MKRIIKLNEQDIREMVKFALNEINMPTIDDGKAKLTNTISKTSMFTKEYGQIGPDGERFTLGKMIEIGKSKEVCVKANGKIDGKVTDKRTAMAEYASQHLKQYGRGMQRMAFELTPNIVLKINVGKKLGQFENEYATSLLGDSEFLRRTYYQSPDMTWSLCENCVPLEANSPEWKEILGLPGVTSDKTQPSIQGFFIWAQSKCDGNRAADFKRDYSKVLPGDNSVYKELASNHPWFRFMYNIIQSGGNRTKMGVDLISIGGLSLKFDSFGVRNNNGKKEIVLMDFGKVKPFGFIGDQKKLNNTMSLVGSSDSTEFNLDVPLTKDRQSYGKQERNL